MKKFFMILFSFLFVSTAFIGGSLLLSGCNSSNVSENLPNDPTDVPSSDPSDEENNNTSENPGEGNSSFDDIENKDEQDVTLKNETGTVKITYENFYGTNSISLNIEFREGETPYGTLLASQTVNVGQTITFNYEYKDEVYTYSIWTNLTFSSQYRQYSAGTIYSTNVWTYNNHPNIDLSIDVREIYTITYNGNGATSGSMSSTIKAHGLSSTISANGFSRSGYTFEGWATSKSGSAIYQPGDSYTRNSNITLYAVWEANTYTITYHSNYPSGTNRTYNQTKYGGTNVSILSISSCGFSTPSGYTFEGWATTSTGSVRYDAGDTYSTNADEDLYAVWEQTTYDVTLKVNFVRNYGTYDVALEISGSGLTTKRISENGTATFTYNTDGSASSITVTVRETSPAPNYFYVGTSSTPTSMTSYSFTWSRNADKTVNIYTEQRYAITYNKNASDATGTMSTTYYRYNSWPTIASNGFSRTGYVFAGWSTTSSGSVSYQPGNTYTTNGYPTLYAVWNRLSYTITYNGNGQTSGNMSSTIKYYDTAVTLSANTFTKTGYHFMGWATTQTGSVVYSDQALYTANASVTLYAVWSVNVYYVSFNPNGGEGSMSSQTFTYGISQALKLNTFIRDGYSFIGWNINQYGLSTSYSNGQTVSNLALTNGATVVLYAQWKANNQAHYDSVGGYWYVEIGNMPQSKVDDALKTTLTSNWASLVAGDSYYFAGMTLTSKVYNNEEYCEYNGEYYLVEPIKWRLTYSSNQTSGYGTTDDTLAIMATIVYVGQYSDVEINTGAGYSSLAVTGVLNNISETGYFVSETKSMPTFGTTSLNGTAESVTSNIFIASSEEIEEVAGPGRIEFSDLVKAYLLASGKDNLYFTRDLGTNYNNIFCMNGNGDKVQYKAQNYFGVQFSVLVTEYACV